ncbi:MAG TPA: DUF1998 domain-containing protein [Verrucomicrobiae bacterium]|nr:DUF1998 domain-containing protein [Verrucomicrobiae bacterium]
MSRFSNDKNSSQPTLRRSQTVTTFGIGAIADLPNASLMVCGIDKWDPQRGIKLYDPRLEKKLGANYFLMAPEAPIDGIVAVRFPRWMRCRNKLHNALMPLEDWRESAVATSRFSSFDERPYCHVCSLDLIPSRFVVACRKGHIDDFPFIEWAHTGRDICSKPKLEYRELGNSSSLSGIIIHCGTCGSSRSMGGSFGRDNIEKIAHCKGSMPWEMIWSSQCGENLTTLQRGGTNVHFPVIKSSILIPPHSTEGLKSRIIDTPLWAAFESQQNAEDLEFYLERISAQLTEPIEKVRAIVNEMMGDDEDKGDGKNEEEYRYEEYLAFMGEYDDSLNNKKDFLIEKQDAAKYKLSFVDSVVLVKKLREIRVQTGFSRIRPPQASDDASVKDDEKIETMSVTQNKRFRWKPGYEVRGEGIFIEFKPSQLRQWAKNPRTAAHYKNLLVRNQKNPDSFGVVDELTPEFIFLHTLAHLLVRQLSFECGYSSSALRERLYCTSSSKGKPMYGILIYTAEGDSDGTLGGLVRQGEADLFPDTVMKAVTEAQWCSSDPLCIESDGQGYQALNLAACHSCCMLPETSCELMNRYLDRAAIVGTLSDPEIGIFSEELNQL